MKSVKNKLIEWSHNYEDRIIIKNLFPICVLDVREADILNWDIIWEYASDLSKVSYAERRQLSEEFNSIVRDKQHEISSKIDNLEAILSKSSISIEKGNSREFAKSIIQIISDGKIFKFNKKKFEYYSTGTNSLNYITLIFNIINSISYYKLKDPLIIIDEPETSLHPYYVDELFSCIEEILPNVQMLMSTHSPRLVKNIITNFNNNNLLVISSTLK